MSPEEGFVARLTKKAERLALARAAAVLAARRGRPERKWRSARFIWPLFGSSE